MKAVVLNSQSLLDIALQELGSISGMFELAELAGVSITDELETGQALEIPLHVGDKQIRDYYTSHALHPATGIAPGSVFEGIEAWGIEYDFFVVR